MWSLVPPDPQLLPNKPECVWTERQVLVFIYIEIILHFWDTSTFSPWMIQKLIARNLLACNHFLQCSEVHKIDKNKTQKLFIATI